jgi:hypothetical protein
MNLLDKIHEATKMTLALCKHAPLVKHLCVFVMEPCSENYRRWKSVAEKSLLGRKLSQILSEQKGLFPPLWTKSLRDDFCRNPPAHAWKDSLPPLQRFFERVEVDVLDEDLFRRATKSVKNVVSSDLSAVGAIGQVYVCDRWAVKILHPDVAAELESISSLFTFASRSLTALGFHSMASMLSRVPQQLVAQADFRKELLNMRTFSEQLRCQKLRESCAIQMPVPVAASREVLLMSSLPSSGAEAVSPARWRKLACSVCALQWENSFCEYLLHGDLHAGNLGVSEHGEGREKSCDLILYDFGLMTRVESRLAIDIFVGVTHMDSERVLRTIATSSPTTEQVEIVDRIVTERCVAKYENFTEVLIESLLRHPKLRSLPLKHDILDMILTQNYNRSLINGVMQVSTNLPLSAEKYLTAFDKTGRHLARGLYMAAFISNVIRTSGNSQKLFNHLWNVVHTDLLLGMDIGDISDQKMIRELLPQMPVEERSLMESFLAHHA